jgi:pilus assembly protein Flp/PilA
MYQWLYVQNYLRSLVTDEEGQGLAEYGMIIALVAVIAIAGVTAFGEDLSSFLEGLSGRFGFFE